MLRFLEISNDTLFVYYLISNLIYLALLITAIFKNTLHRHRLASLRLERLKIFPVYATYLVTCSRAQRRALHRRQHSLSLEPGLP